MQAYLNIKDLWDPHYVLVNTRLLLSPERQRILSMGEVTTHSWHERQPKIRQDLGKDRLSNQVAFGEPQPLKVELESCGH